MSIIEKAVGKLGSQAPNAPIQQEDQYPAGEEYAAEVGSFDQYGNAGDNSEELDNTNREIVQLPTDKLNQVGMVTFGRPRSQIAEEYRMIKRPLLRNIEGKSSLPIKHANLIMVTSSLEGEGKTFTAINLAMSIALEQNKTVLFIDADFSKGSATSFLEIPGDRPGLIDVLEHEDISIKDVLVHTDIPNLRIIPAGHLHERSTEMLASESMQSLMEEISYRYPDRVVVFDSPPLMQTTEANVLANLVGQIVFVVAAEITPVAVVKEALEHFSENKVVGTVLNKSKQYLWDQFRYGYGYGRTYGYGQTTSDQ